MKWILENWQMVAQIITIVLTTFCGIMVFVRTRSVTTAIQVMKEVENLMKYKTLEENEKTRSRGTSFSPYRDCYVLNPSTNELEKLPTQENIQDKINSFLDCALERALERFMPKNVIEKDDVAEQYSQRQVDLADLANAMEIAEEYRDKFGLSDKMSMGEIYGFVDGQAKALKQRLDEFSKKKEEDKNNESKEKEAK